MPGIELTAAQRASVEAIPRAHAPGLMVRVFGSRATWRARPLSDLDLVIMTEQPLPLERVADLRDAFSESDLPFRVDLLDWASVSAAFRRRIDETAVVLIEPVDTPAGPAGSTPSRD